MEKILTSILMGFCLFLGTISSQAKSFKIVEHISSEHSGTHKTVHTHHHHDHHHKHHHKHEKPEKKTSKSHDHHHAVELSLATIYLALPLLNEFVSELPQSIRPIAGFYSLTVLGQLSFSPPVFRPPIV